MDCLFLRMSTTSLISSSLSSSSSVTSPSSPSGSIGLYLLMYFFLAIIYSLTEEKSFNLGFANSSTTISSVSSTGTSVCISIDSSSTGASTTGTSGGGIVVVVSFLDSASGTVIVLTFP